MSRAAAQFSELHTRLSSWFHAHVNALIILCVLFGCTARIVQYVSRQSFSHDEAFLVMNLLHRSAGELISEPLQHNQAAPPVFLLIERAAAVTLGSSEYSLRLVPLLLALAAVILFAVLAKKKLSPIPAVASVALFASSGRLIWHAAEVKQYSGDICCALVLLAIAILPQRPSRPFPRLLLLSAATAILMWFSHPTLFIFTGISLALLPQILRQHRHGLLKFALANVPAALSFLLLHRFSIRVQRDIYLDTFWQADFIPWQTPFQIPAWLLSHGVELFTYPFAGAGMVLLLLALLSPLLRLPAKEKTWMTILACPVLLNLIAAGAHQYPFNGSRLTVYLVGPILLLAAAGLQWLQTAVPAALRNWTWIIPASLVAVSVSIASWRLFFPQFDSNIRPVARYVEQHFRQGDIIFALDWASINPPTGRAYSFQCYWKKKTLVTTAIPAPPFTSLGKRFWVTYAASPRAGEKPLKPLIEKLKQSHPLLDEFHVRGGAAYLFESAPATQPATPATKPGS